MIIYKTTGDVNTFRRPDTEKRKMKQGTSFEPSAEVNSQPWTGLPATPLEK